MGKNLTKIRQGYSQASACQRIPHKFGLETRRSESGERGSVPEGAPFRDDASQDRIILLPFCGYRIITLLVAPRAQLCHELSILRSGKSGIRCALRQVPRGAAQLRR